MSAVVVNLGNPDGTFQASASYPVPGSVGGILVSDVNNDGIQDVVVGAIDLSGLTVLIGKGDGTFDVEGQVIDAPLGTVSGLAGDFNGDGLVDLAQVSISVEVSCHKSLRYYPRSDDRMPERHGGKRKPNGKELHI